MSEFTETLGDVGASSRPRAKGLPVKKSSMKMTTKKSTPFGKKSTTSTRTAKAPLD